MAFNSTSMMLVLMLPTRLLVYMSASTNLEMYKCHNIHVIISECESRQQKKEMGKRNDKGVQNNGPIIYP